MIRKEIGIEGKIERLEKWVRAIHEKLNLHEWVKDYRPWNVADAGTKRKPHVCANYCDHHVYYIECACGVSRKATKAEFDAAEDAYDGY